MTVNNIHLFCINNAIIQGRLDAARKKVRLQEPENVPIEQDDMISPYLGQFALRNRRDAQLMSRYYQLFYMLENEIRSFVSDVLSDADKDWWKNRVTTKIKEAVSYNQERELSEGVTPRSNDPLDYTTFGQLRDIIKENWDLFGGLISNKSAVERVLNQLNTLRGPIAHCNVLADDEVDRLRLTIKDWFRLLGG